MPNQSDTEIIEDSADRSRKRPKVSRRTLIKGGISAMPAILTLQSGAALARSSYLISASSPGTTDGLGRTMCLDTNSVVPAGGSGDVFDMAAGGSRPYAKINIITPHDFKADHNFGSADVSEAALCEGRLAWFNERDGMGWQSVEMPYRGVVVSSAAILSNAAYIEDHLW